MRKVLHQPRTAAAKSLAASALLWLCTVAATVSSAQTIPFGNTPTGFFTNVASRLLSTELNVDLGHIQIYPTNEYTPAVHRLLQITANLYEATTNRPPELARLPCVFRPRFGQAQHGPEIFINGYEEVTNTSILAAAFRDVRDPGERLALKPDDMVYGIPLIIGARKGLPNFNELALQTDIMVSRKLEFRRAVLNGPITETNQMYLIGISNLAGLEAWNSYTNSFERPLQLYAALDLTGLLTNEAAVLFSNRFSIGASLNISNWPGNVGTNGFVIPLAATNTFLPLSTYRQEFPAFIPFTTNFERGMGYPVPHWSWELAIRLRFMLIDQEADRIIDYVNVTGEEMAIDVTAFLMQDAACDGPNGSIGSQFCTNRVFASNSLLVPTYGILNQIHVSDGSIMPDNWSSYNQNDGPDRQAAIARFRYNLYGITTPGYGTFYRSNVFQAPFDPVRKIYQHVSWQANDPLVHYLLTDLSDPRQTNSFNFIPFNPPLDNLGRINDRYEPWAYFRAYRNPTYIDAKFKDPLVTRPDSWNFPAEQDQMGPWLGRVHRGTPWQTLYLKSDSPDPAGWRTWSGSSDPAQAALLQPTRDWAIAERIYALFRTNPPQSLLSVNETNPAAWSVVLHEIQVLSNNIPDASWAGNPFLTAQFDSLIMLSNSPQAGALAAAIAVTRQTQVDSAFHSAADLIATRELSFGSPWLNLSSIQLTGGINDEAYEAIPGALLMRVRSDSAGRVVSNATGFQIQFTGYDNFPYRIETSTNLANWEAVSTNYPTNGMMRLPATLDTSARYYRSVLLP